MNSRDNTVSEIKCIIFLLRYIPSLNSASHRLETIGKNGSLPSPSRRRRGGAGAPLSPHPEGPSSLKSLILQLFLFDIPTLQSPCIKPASSFRIFVCFVILLFSTLCLVCYTKSGTLWGFLPNAWSNASYHLRNYSFSSASLLSLKVLTYQTDTVHTHAPISLLCLAPQSHLSFLYDYKTHSWPICCVLLYLRGQMFPLFCFSIFLAIAKFSRKQH